MGSWPCLGAPLLGPSPGFRQRMRQDVEAQLGKPGCSKQTTARCCNKCREAFVRAVPNLCCLSMENCQTAR